MTTKSAIDMSSIGDSVGRGLSNAGSQLSTLWKSLPEETRANLLWGGAGAGGAALLTKMLAGKGGFDDEDHKPGISPVLLAALVGGGAGVASRYGGRMLTGDIRFGRKPIRNPVDSLADKAVGGLLRHPFASVGGAFGVNTLIRKFPTMDKAERVLRDKNVFMEAAQRADLEKALEGAKSTGGMRSYGRSIFGPSRTSAATTRAHLGSVVSNLWRGKFRDAGKAIASSGSGAKSLAANLLGTIRRGGALGLRYNPGDVARYMKFKHLTPNLSTLYEGTRAAGKFSANPRNAIALAALAPALGMLADRYAFGRND